MTTKEQERNALAKIMKIVADLGEGSYIATAFEGCFEIARENIDNDWACSMRQRRRAHRRSCGPAGQRGISERRQGPPRGQGGNDPIHRPPRQSERHQEERPDAGIISSPPRRNEGRKNQI